MMEQDFTHSRQAGRSHRGLKRQALLAMTVVGLTIVALTGCRSSKQLIGKPSKEDRLEVENCLFNRPDYKVFDSKVEYQFSSKPGITTSIRGNLRLKKDSCLLVSIQPFAGIEMAKCLLRPDSLLVVSRMHQLYAKEGLNQLPKVSPDWFDIMERIIFNQPFIPGKNELKPADLDRFEWRKEDKTILLELKQDTFRVVYRIDEKRNFTGFQLFAATEADPLFQVDYSKFREIDGASFPTFISMKVQEKGKNPLVLQLNFFRISPSGQVDFSFPISSKYRQVALKELIKRYQDML
jgi:hypothetical protein